MIHAGLYYPTGSLRHRLCVEGRRKLYAYLVARGVPHRKCGKLIVATSEQETAQIEAIYRRGLANGVENLELLEGADAMAMEPSLSCSAAIWSPETGLIDSHAYMLALQGELDDHAGTIAFKTPVEAIQPIPGGGFRVSTGGEPSSAISCRRLVNSAGLHAQRVARAIQGLRAEFIPKLVLANGTYFGFPAKPAFSRLIYPAPAEGGLGVHPRSTRRPHSFGPYFGWLATRIQRRLLQRRSKRSGSFMPASCATALAARGALRGYRAADRSSLPRRTGWTSDRLTGPALHRGLVTLFGSIASLTSSPAMRLGRALLAS